VLKMNETNNVSLPKDAQGIVWTNELINAHRTSSLVLFSLFAFVSVVLCAISVINGWKLLNTSQVSTNCDFGY
jgi:hypothetical protein